jgi:hypothetical protein
VMRQSDLHGDMQSEAEMTSSVSGDIDEQQMCLR